ncbi:MAG TPA: dihydrolipoamide acetyltransferase family protein [Ruminiclostridium sp.]
MATMVIMPRQGQSVESCIIAKWYKKKGDSVAIGDLLFSYETDKASFEEESKVEGVMLGVFCEEGDDVPCLNNVCAIGQLGEVLAEDASAPKASEASELQTISVPGNVALVQEADVSGVTATVGNANNAAIKISPRARHFAEKAGVDIYRTTPTGPNGRIIERDVLEAREKGFLLTAAARTAYAGSTILNNGTGLGGRITTADLATASAAVNTVATTSSNATHVAAEQLQGLQSETERVKITNIRKVIAKAMYNSISTTCQLTLNSSFDATEIMEFRKKIKAGKDKFGLENVTLNDIILYAVSRTLLGFRDLNAHFLEDSMLYFKNVNLGVAIDTDRGLMVPTIFNANFKSLNEISSQVKALAKECQSGKINPDLLKDGSFTVTNLGTFDIESFTPVLNAPQTGILGVNNITQRAKEVDGEIIFYPAMGLSLTFDHRAIDGAPAAKFLQALKHNLQNFSCLLVKG